MVIFKRWQDTINMNTVIGITCVGGYYAYELIECFRNQDDFNATIVGFDANPKASGRFFCDKFQVIPSAKDSPEKFISSVIEACSKSSIDFFIPSSEEECKAVSDNIDLFNANSIDTSIGNSEIVDVMTDKFSFLDYLDNNGVDVGRFYSINLLDDVLKSLNNLGYPENKVVLKPRNGSGSRGVLIVDSDLKVLNEIIPDRNCAEGNIELIVEYAKNSKIDFSSYMAMEYYSGDVYDIDCVARDGDAINVVPRLRKYDNPLSPYNEGCIISQDKNIISYVSDVISALQCHGACDFDIAIDSLGRPRVIDASTRLSGSVAASKLAGINIPAQLVRIIKRMPTKQYNPLDKVCVRPAKIFIEVLDCGQ